MTASELLTDIKTKAEALWASFQAFSAAHPEVQSVDAAALSVAVADVATAAKTEVQEVAPPSADALLDAAIQAAETEAQTKIADITAAKDAKVAALQSAKSGAQ